MAHVVAAFQHAGTVLWVVNCQGHTNTQ